ncbi:uncharacterized protein LOC108713500 [Xenopus laevis]|uniref:Protein FAM166B n=2 Tax=Xenopus laevis TaxID=8355 RepID=A0A974E1I6_XENLA|nr:uncharacterized protein LOC108713500 [Xenopus laevis]OCU00882.1 hypothetical protein XELAEV_18006659mg [Xenopus laevis]
MPIILPQLPEVMFSTYDPQYIPGYTTQIPKLRSDAGYIYGNATQTSSNHEPGVQRCTNLPLTGWRDRQGPVISMHSGTRDIPREQAESWNIKKGYFYPIKRRYYATGINNMYNGDLRISTAIQTVEGIKHELHSPDQLKTFTSDTSKHLRMSRESLKQKATFHGRSEQERPLPRLSPFAEKNERDPIPSSYTTNYNQEQQGKLIYRTDSGILPNYGGYIPGQMFAIGKTWGKTSVNALGKLKEQPFVWTSLL